MLQRSLRPQHIHHQIAAPHHLCTAPVLQEKVIRLDECMGGVSAEAVQQLLMYMYSPDPLVLITSLSYEQLESAAVLADIWAMTRFLELCDAYLHGGLNTLHSPGFAAVSMFFALRLCGQLEPEC